MEIEFGTLIECDAFSAIVVASNLLLVFDIKFPDYMNVNDLLCLNSLGPNDWMISVSMDYGVCDNYWIKRDWNGVIETNLADYWSDWYNDDDDYYDYLRNYVNEDIVESYDDYKSLSSPAHNPRCHRVFFGRGKWGGRRRP